MEKIPKKGYPMIADDYMLYEEVGEGVSAVVYKALCIPHNETVAIKILDLESNKHGLDSVRREVQIMSLIDHPNLLRAYCSFMVGSKLWIVLPYMAGGSFFHIMKSTHPEGFEQSVIATVLRQVIKALAYLHAHGHIHRDVKAGNVLLDSKGTVKLADFGVSASLFDAGDRERPRNSFVGTPCWMAPEVMQQVHGYDYKADIWSFGITALELAHGHAPFSKYPPMKVLLMTLQNAPPGLDYKRDKKFTKSFKELVAACLVKDPRKRPTAGKLLTHRFFKYARSHEYLAKAIFDDICPLGDRFKMLQAQEFGGEEQQSQMQYLRGISAWNFDLEDMMKQIQECDSISSMDDQSFSCKRKNSFFNLFALSERPSEEHLNKSTYTESETSEEALKDVKDIGSSSVPVLTYQSEANDDQLPVNQKTDNNASPSVKNTSDELCFQQQEQLKDTGIVISHKDEPYNFVDPYADQSVNQLTSTASLTLSSLHCILQQNTMQREQINRLISYVEDSIGNNMEPEGALRKEVLFQTSSTAARENILQILVTSMEESVRKLDEDLCVQKTKNYQLERQMNQYLRKD